MYQYQQDDLVYDLEIRGNIFVLSQYYPKRHQYIMSILEQLDPQAAQAQNNSFDWSKTSPNPNDDQSQLSSQLNGIFTSIKHPQLFNDLINLVRNEQNRQNKLADQDQKDSPEQSYRFNRQQLAKLIAKYHGIKPLLKQLQELTELPTSRKQAALKIIKNANPALVKGPDKITNWQWENLNDPLQFIQFAKRYGIPNQLNNGYKLHHDDLTFNKERTNQQTGEPYLSKTLFSPNNLTYKAKYLFNLADPNNPQQLSDFKFNLNVFANLNNKTSNGQGDFGEAANQYHHQFIPGLQTANWYYPIKDQDDNPDIDKFSQTLTHYDKANDHQGLRIGFNSDNYDSTFIIRILAAYSPRLYNTFLLWHNYQKLINLPEKPKNTTNYLLHGFDLESNEAQKLAKDLKQTININPNNQQPEIGTIYYFQYLVLMAYLAFYRQNTAFYPATEANQKQNNALMVTPETLIPFNDDMFQNHNHFMPGALKDDVTFLLSNLSNDHVYSRNGYGMRTGYTITNRFVDVAKFFPLPIPLKRIAGMLGEQIKESSTNNDPHQPLHSLAEIADLVAYNVSDIYATHRIFINKTMQSTFKMRQQLLDEYPILIYEHQPAAKDLMQPAAGNPCHLRTDRLTVNSTNGQFVENYIAPYPNTKIVDKPVVDFHYPDAQVLAARQKDPQQKTYYTKPIDVLEDTMKWAQEHGIGKEFEPIYKLYDQYRGVNLNYDLANGNHDQYWLEDSYEAGNLPYGATIDKWTDYSHQKYVTTRNHLKRLSQNNFPYLSYQENKNQKPTIKYIYTDWQGNQRSKPYRNDPTFKPSYSKAAIHYYDQNKQPTASIATFSVGGIHGYETKYSQYLNDIKDYQQELFDQNELAFANQFVTNQTIENYFDQLTNPALTIDDQQSSQIGQTFKGHISRKKYKNIPYQAFSGKSYLYKELLKGGKAASLRQLKTPKSFWTKDGSKASKEYKYISTVLSRHQDFSSYYPTLLTMLAVFRNADGNDAYAKLYHERLHLKAIAKDPTKDQTTRDQANRAQKPRKLLLNSASGKGDLKGITNSSIKCNNATISMRIIGQLFAWRIGQALAFDNARVPSTNTDGIYIAGIDAQTNDKTLNATIAPMMLDIQPEEIHKFVSKDANNRLEIGYDHKKQQAFVKESKGGTLSSWDGVLIEKTTNHPMIIDRLLTYYLWKKDNASDHVFDQQVGKQQFDNVLTDLLTNQGAVATLNFFQWILYSNTASNSIIFPAEINKATGQLTNKFKLWEATNRLFLVTPQGRRLLTGETEQDNPWRLLMAGQQIVNAQKTLMEQYESLYLPQEKPNLTAAQYAQITQEDFSSHTVLTHLNTAELMNNDGLAQKVFEKAYTTKQMNEHFYQIPALATDPKGADKSQKLKNINLKKITDFPEDQDFYRNNSAIAQYSKTTTKNLLLNLDYATYYAMMINKFYAAWSNLTTKEQTNQTFDHQQFNEHIQSLILPILTKASSSPAN